MKGKAMKDYRYPWPSSRLNGKAMNLLFRERERLRKKGIKKPINQLVKEAVESAFCDSPFMDKKNSL